MALTAGITGSFATNTDANDARSNAAATGTTESNYSATESNDARSNMAATGTNKRFISNVLLNANEKLQRNKRCKC